MNFLVTILVSTILISLCSSAEPKCKKNGFFRHPDDCTRFYRCVDLSGRGRFYKKYTFSCQEGTVFDETLRICNYKWAVPPCAKGMEEETEVPEESTEDYTERCKLCFRWSFHTAFLVGCLVYIFLLQLFVSVIVVADQPTVL